MVTPARAGTLDTDPAAARRGVHRRGRLYRHTRLPVDLASTLIPDAYTLPRVLRPRAGEGLRQRAGSRWASSTDVDRPGPLPRRRGRRPLDHRHPQPPRRAARLPQRVPPPRHEAARRRRPRGRPPPPHPLPVPQLDLRHRRHVPGHPAVRGLRRPAPARRPIFDTSAAKGFDRADYGLLARRGRQPGASSCSSTSPPTRSRCRPRSATCRERFADYRLEQWLPQRRSTYDVAANYKLVGENFMEYYHLPWVHPELNKVSKFSDHYRWQGPGMYTGMCTTPVSRNTDAGGWDGLPPLAPLGDAGRRRRPLRVAVPQHRPGRPAQPRLRAVQPPRRGEPHHRDRGAAEPPRLRATTRTPSEGVEQLRSSGTWSTGRTSRSSSGSRRASRTPPTAAGGCASASRSRCTASRT